MFNGKYVRRVELPHECRLPGEGLFSSPHTGDIWECKCGKQYECQGLETMTMCILWKYLENETTMNHDDVTKRLRRLARDIDGHYSEVKASMPLDSRRVDALWEVSEMLNNAADILEEME